MSFAFLATAAVNTTGGRRAFAYAISRDGITEVVPVRAPFDPHTPEARAVMARWGTSPDAVAAAASAEDEGERIARIAAECSALVVHALDTPSDLVGCAMNAAAHRLVPTHVAGLTLTGLDTPHALGLLARRAEALADGWQAAVEESEKEPLTLRIYVSASGDESGLSLHMRSALLYGDWSLGAAPLDLLVSTVGDYLPHLAPRVVPDVGSELVAESLTRLGIPFTYEVLPG